MPGIPDSEWPKVRSMKEKGLVLREIAEKYDTSIATASKFVRRHTEENFSHKLKDTQPRANAVQVATPAPPALRLVQPTDAPLLKTPEDRTRDAVLAALGDFQFRDVARVLVDGLSVLLNPDDGARNSVALAALADRLVYASAYLRMNQSGEK